MTHDHKVEEVVELLRMVESASANGVLFIECALALPAQRSYGDCLVRRMTRWPPDRGLPLPQRHPSGAVQLRLESPTQNDVGVENNVPQGVVVWVFAVKK